MRKVELEIGNTLAGLLYFWTFLASALYVVEKVA